MAAVTLASLSATACLLTVPGVGLWYADVTLASEHTLSGPVVLKILDTTWSGTIIAGGAYDGRSRYRIVAGLGGWGGELPPRAYANDAGLTIARLVADAAAEAGEPAPVDAPTTRLGNHYSRPRGPASFALNLLAPRAWYARADGVIAFGTRPAAPAASLPVVAREAAGRVVEFATVETISAVVPGMTTEFGVASDVEIELSPDGIRARAYASAARSRRVAAFAALMAAADPSARFRGLFEYRVVSQSGERLNLQPIRSRADMPDLARVPVRAGVAGTKAQHTPGSAVLVAFLDNGDPTRPAVVGFDEPTQPGWMPTTLDLGGPSPLGVARRTDPVQAGAFSGVITGGSARIRASV